MGRFARDDRNRKQNRYTLGQISGPHVSIEDCPVMLGIKSDNWWQAVEEY